MNDTLKKKIVEEMTVDFSNALEKNFGFAKQFVRITRDGKVDVLCKDRLTGKENILLYLIGKLYAKEAGLTMSDDVGNRELIEELGVPENSLLPWLKALRDDRIVRQVKRGRLVYHAIRLNLVERTLRSIEKKMKKVA